MPRTTSIWKARMHTLEHARHARACASSPLTMRAACALDLRRPSSSGGASGRPTSATPRRRGCGCRSAARAARAAAPPALRAGRRRGRPAARRPRSCFSEAPLWGGGGSSPHAPRYWLGVGVGAVECPAAGSTAWAMATPRLTPAQVVNRRVCVGCSVPVLVRPAGLASLQPQP